jgi:DNA-binding CsgD family transcriptional regulator
MKKTHNFQVLLGGASRTRSTERSRALKFADFLSLPAFAVAPIEMEAGGATQSADRGPSGAADGIRGTTPSREFVASCESGEDCSLSMLWTELVEGRVRVVDHFDTDDHSYLVLEEKQAQGHALTRRQIEVLKRLLLGDSQKMVAFEQDRSLSSVASEAAAALRGIGVPSSASRVPMVLAMAAHAHHGGQTRFIRARRTSVYQRDRVYSWFRVERPDALLSTILTPAECAVMRLLVEGKSHAQIAALRQTSRRTIANQLASSFLKFGVSGRSALLAALIRGWEERAVPATSPIDSPTWPFPTRFASGVA